MISREFLYRLEDEINRARHEINEKHMGRQSELRERFNAPDLTVRQLGHFQIINLDGQEITIGSMATDEQIAAEIAKIREEKPMAKSLKLQGLSGKLTKLKHDLEFDAGKMSDRIDTVAIRKDSAFSKGHQFLDATEANIGEVEEFVKALEAATNGGDA